jgi:hypothetical protein
MQDLEQIAEDEFSELIDVITEKEIVTQVQKITKESEFQIRDAKEKMAKEFNLLRLQLLDRNEEIETLKRSKLQEIDRAKTEAYERAEKRFLENSKIKETRF